MRRSHFAVFGRFDGAARATVTIEQTAAGLFFRVRPHRRRRVFELLLSDVARSVIYDVVKAELAERKRAQRERRRAVGR